MRAKARCVCNPCRRKRASTVRAAGGTPEIVPPTFKGEMASCGCRACERAVARHRARTEKKKQNRPVAIPLVWNTVERTDAELDEIAMRDPMISRMTW